MNQPQAITSIGFLLFPGVTQLDLTGPHEVFSRLPDVKVHLLWKNLDPVRADSGLTILPTARLSDALPLDLLCVPGGPGQVALMEDPEVLGFLRKNAETCRFITSVCTGSLVLGAAGLLKGYRATCHWASLDQLTALGATPVAERVVVDGNRITGAGVTSGIDFALAVVLRTAGEAMAKRIQLQMEYDPAPPFAAGSPAGAGPEVTAQLLEQIRSFQERRRAVTLRAASALKDT